MLSLPSPNEFLPTDFSLICEQPAYKVIKALPSRSLSSLPIFSPSLNSKFPFFLHFFFIPSVVSICCRSQSSRQRTTVLHSLTCALFLPYSQSLAPDDPVHPSPPSLLFPSSAQALPASLPASSPERGVKVFHKLDTTFKVPKVQFFAHLLSRQVGRDGRRGDRDGEIEGEEIRRERV